MDRQLPRAIIFFGPDGAGKTTQARLLFAYLKFRKHRTWRAWIRGRHSLAFVLSNLLKRLGYYRVVKTRKAEFRVFDPHLLRQSPQIWALVEFISVLPWIITRMYLPITFGYAVIAERYVIDTLAYVGYWVSPSLLRSFLARTLLLFIPRGAVLIYLDAKTEILEERISDDIVTKDFIIFQKKTYDAFAKTLKVNMIDTSKRDVRETFRDILEILQGRVA